MITMTGMAQNQAKNMKTVYDFSLKDKKGNEVSLSQYKGKVLLIVNTPPVAVSLHSMRILKQCITA